MRRFSILLVALPIAVSACGDDADDPVFLGALDAGPVEDASPNVVQPVPTMLARSSCANSTPVLGPDIANTVLSIGILESRAILTQDASVRAVKLNVEPGAEGCPGAPLASFGTDGTLAIDASAAAPVPVTAALVAVGDGTLILDSSGSEIGRCQVNGENLVVRSLQVGADGKVVAAFAKTPVSRLTIDGANCAVETFALSSPFVFVQVAPARDGGFVTVEQASASSAMVVAHYDAKGAAVSSSELAAIAGAAKLCSATGLVDTPAGILVTDTACHRVVLFEEFDLPNPPDGSPAKMLQLTAAADFEDTPVGAALTPDEGHVLVAVAQAVENGAIATFERIVLP